MLITSTIYSQQTFTISGTIRNLRTKEPADKSILVAILSETNQPYKTYCDKNGKYKFTLPDSLDRKRLTISIQQDKTKFDTIHISGPCPTDYPVNNLYYTEGKTQNVTIHLDSIKDYVFDFYLSYLSRCYEQSFPDPIFFQKK